MLKSTFHIAKMDCPSEEQLIRMSLEGTPCILKLDFDIANRRLAVFHDCQEINDVTQKLMSLNLGASLIQSEAIVASDIPTDDTTNSQKDRNLLIKILIINASFFLIESIWGWISNSMGLISDGLDMLADALVYSLALSAVGKVASFKKKVSKWAGGLQLVLAILGLFEVLRRAFYHVDLPDFQGMILVSSFALMGNLASLYLLRKSQNSEAHIKASLIFTSNDVLANLGVMLAGFLVLFTESLLPDLIIGFIVFGMVLRGAFQILKL
jgi:Co/Zn/Cd efflux system component